MGVAILVHVRLSLGCAYCKLFTRLVRRYSLGGVSVLEATVMALSRGEADMEHFQKNLNKI